MSNVKPIRKVQLTQSGNETIVKVLTASGKAALTDQELRELGAECFRISGKKHAKELAEVNK